MITYEGVWISEINGSSGEITSWIRSFSLNNVFISKCNWRRFIEAVVVSSGGTWRVKHDGEPIGRYQTKEAAFEAAVTAASLAVREGYQVQLSVPGARIES